MNSYLIRLPQLLPGGKLKLKLKLQREQAAEQQRQNQLRAQMASLSARVHENRNFLDPMYREHFVRKHQRQILTELRPVWAKEYTDLMSDSQLVALLKVQAPQVVQWFEHRIDMIFLAERRELLPPDADAAPLGSVPLTPRAVQRVNDMITELFQLREEYCRIREDYEAESGGPPPWAQLEHTAKAIGLRFQELRGYGIAAATPEEAEEQLQRRLPPKPDYYQELRKRVEVGEKLLVFDALFERLEDLHREKIILSAKRREAIRKDRHNERESADDRLVAIRQEATELKSFLEASGFEVKFEERQSGQKAESREDQFFTNYEEMKRIVSALAREGDDDGIEQVKALYAQEQAKLFEGENESYT